MIAANVVRFDPPRPRRLIDRHITVTIFLDQYATRKIEKVVRFRNLPDAISKLTGREKEELPFLKTATFGDEPSPKGCYRTNTNLVLIDGVEVDSSPNR